jgi:hypothetical protein
MRTITVVCKGGLANRLRVVLAGFLLAQEYGRQLRVCWSPSPACGVSWADLFAKHEDVTLTDSHAAPVFENPIDLVQFRAALASATTEVAVRSGDILGLENMEKVASLVDCIFRLRAPLQMLVEAYQKARFSPTMMGVHVRRGDLPRISDSGGPDLVAYLQATAVLLKRQPLGTGIFLATDDGASTCLTSDQPRREGVAQRFKQAFGDRVRESSKRSLARSSREAIEDAIVGCVATL